MNPAKDCFEIHIKGVLTETQFENLKTTLEKAFAENHQIEGQPKLKNIQAFYIEKGGE